MRRIAALGAALAIPFGLAVPAAEGEQAACTAPVANVSGVGQAEGTSAEYTTLVFIVSLTDGGCAPQGTVEYRTIEGNGSPVDPACGHADLGRKGGRANGRGQGPRRFPGGERRNVIRSEPGSAA
ncbi:hypothetical protein ACFORH_02735 [Amycolatopsis roodepoortensis]|uniref:Uncharacterized protein n=1 Tax=Amycolatopsis roodepoortensis TaxID=700274 RepID=A0ABR9L6B4_9PSEU|nr:hypothetical protein [Amycolatopsis roodepoortensis]MBE1575912.1 hypothetical protein [Amycolatopsis roodepoortensis]